MSIDVGWVVPLFLIGWGASAMLIGIGLGRFIRRNDVRAEKSWADKFRPTGDDSDSRSRHPTSGGNE